MTTTNGKKMRKHSGMNTYETETEVEGITLKRFGNGDVYDVHKQIDKDFSDEEMEYYFQLMKKMREDICLKELDRYEEMIEHLKLYRDICKKRDIENSTETEIKKLKKVVKRFSSDLEQLNDILHDVLWSRERLEKHEEETRRKIVSHRHNLLDHGLVTEDTVEWSISDEEKDDWEVNTGMVLKGIVRRRWSI